MEGQPRCRWNQTSGVVVLMTSWTRESKPIAVCAGIRFTVLSRVWGRGCINGGARFVTVNKRETHPTVVVDACLRRTSRALSSGGSSKTKDKPSAQRGAKPSPQLNLSLFGCGYVLCVSVCVCVCVCVFIKLHITAQSGLVILVILCHSR